jgi:DNA end-binding protein Ku
MRYQEELRKPAEYFHDIKKVKIDHDSLELAESLIKKRTARFDPARFTDGYEVALKELVEAKIKHLPVPHDEAPAPQRAKVINLMDALRKSLTDSAPAPIPASGKKKPSKSVTAPLFPEHEEKKGPTLVRSSAKSSARATASKSAKSPKRKSA